MAAKHPNDVLFAGEKPIPVIPACEHFAGSEKLISKALEIQNKLGGRFDITADCEDGAKTGQEKEHMQMVVAQLKSALNQHRMLGVRIHDYTNVHWKQDVDLLIPEGGELTAYITIPKPTRAAQVAEMIDYIRASCEKHGIKREIPIHTLIETQGALREVWEIAALPWMQVLDFGLMDFVSGHQGAVPSDAMRSPGQFEHRLIARAKTETVAAALANGVVPAHNVTLDLKNRYQTYQDARRARREFGFLRMWSIYPTQIEAILEAMQPDFSKIKHACDILLKAQDADWGPIQHEGELHDRATYRDCWHLVQEAHVFGTTLPAEVNRRFFA
ncbi:MAG: CoA ester lyase [Deltaproteobacteria bacterium]|nr:CoA ester lyase [Deltaproteobacteria bacterium]